MVSEGGAPWDFQPSDTQPRLAVILSAGVRYEHHRDLCTFRLLCTTDSSFARVRFEKTADLNM